MLKTICDNEQEYSYQQRIKGKLQGHNLPSPKGQGALYVDMVSELKSLKEDLISWKIGKKYYLICITRIGIVSLNFFIVVFKHCLDCAHFSTGGGKVERIKSTVSTDHSTSDTSQQVGFYCQVPKRSEHSGLNDNVPESQSEAKLSGGSQEKTNRETSLLLSKSLCFIIMLLVWLD